MEEYMQEIYRQLNNEYETMRSNNKIKYQQIMNSIYTHIPRIKAIDEQINGIGLSVCASVIDGRFSATEAVSNMKECVEVLLDEKRKLLKESGLPENYNLDIYNCPICKDRGYVDSKRCSCFNKKLRLLIQKKSNICANSSNCFEKFDLNLYSSTVDAKYGLSPRSNMESVLHVALSYADGDKNAPCNLLFYGATGLGKTFTTDCIAKSFAEKGNTVFYMSAPKLFSTFEDYKFGRDVSAKNKSTINAVSEAELLIIDDLGTEFRSTYIDSILFDIINTRLNENKKMIISTNLDYQQLAKTYSDRIASRILGGFEKVLFFGEDIRIKKLNQ